MTEAGAPRLACGALHCTITGAPLCAASPQAHHLLGSDAALPVPVPGASPVAPVPSCASCLANSLALLTPLPLPTIAAVPRRYRHKLLHALPYQAVFDSLTQWHNILCYSIPNIMDYFLAGDDQPQTNQPTGQAGDKPYLETSWAHAPPATSFWGRRAQPGKSRPKVCGLWLRKHCT